MPLLVCMPLKVLVYLFVSSHCAAGHQDSSLHSLIVMPAHDCNIDKHVGASPAGSHKRTRRHKILRLLAHLHGGGVTLP